MKTLSQGNLSPVQMDAVLKVHKLLHPFLGKLIVARAAVAAFGEAAMRSEAATTKPMDWASIMDAVSLLIPEDDAFEDAMAAVENVMESAFAPVGAVLAQGAPSSATTQRRGQIAARAMETERAES